MLTLVYGLVQLPHRAVELGIGSHVEKDLHNWFFYTELAGAGKRFMAITLSRRSVGLRINSPSGCCAENY
jgi:hypothetical protein